MLDLIFFQLAGNAGGVLTSPGLGRFLEKEMATHSSTLAWEIPWTEEPGGLRSMGPQRVSTPEQLSSSSRNRGALDWSVRLCECWCVLIGPISQRKATRRSQQKTQGILQDPSSFRGSEGLVLSERICLFVYLFVCLSPERMLKALLGF